MEHDRAGFRFDACTDRLTIQDPIRLCPRCTNSRAFAGIKSPELDTCPICGLAHDSAEGIYLLDDVPLTDTADRGIAGHLTDRFDGVRHQQRPGAGSRSRQRSLGPGMTAADDNYIECFGILHLGETDRFISSGSSSRSG